MHRLTWNSREGSEPVEIPKFNDFVQLIFGLHWPMNQLNRTPNIVKLNRNFDRLWGSESESESERDFIVELAEWSRPP